MISPQDSPAEHRGRALALVIGSTMIFAVSDGLAKLLVANIGPFNAFWFRCVVVVLVTMPVVLWRGGIAIFRTTHPMRQSIRALAVAGSSIVFMTALIHLPLADASAIGFVWPVMITVLSIFMLGEKVGFRRALATITGFVGMLIIVRPGSGAFQLAALLPLLSASLWAFASVLTRGMMSTEHPETTIAWSAVVMLAASTLLLPWTWLEPGWGDIGLGVLVGLGAAVGHAMVIFAYKLARASVLAPFAYVQLVWATATGYVLFGAIPDRWVLAGASIIVAAGLYTIHRERIRRGED